MNQITSLRFPVEFLYLLCSVVVNLKINETQYVSAYLPESIFPVWPRH